jgi:biopolymer transport protein ExbD
LVDVMLVLLIIMMLIAPMLQKGVPSAAEGRHTTDKPRRRTRPSCTSTAEGAFYVNNMPVREPRSWIASRRARKQGERIVLIKGDADASYGHHEHDGQAARGGSRTSA